MENKEILKVKYSEEFAEDYSTNLLDDYKELLPELVDFKSTVDKAVENLIKNNSNFRGIPFEHLKTNEEFRKALKEYINKNQPKLSALNILKSIIPKNHVKPNNKLTNKITKNIVDDGEFDLIVSGKKTKKEITTKVMLEYDNKYLDFSGQKYTPYDREVYDGVVTLYAAGNNIITAVMVYRAMNGLAETEYIKPETLEKVKESLDKSRYLRIIIDYTDEARLYNKAVEKTTYEGYILAANKITVQINGQEHEGYKLLDKPILYEYAQISGQIITVPSKLLQTKDAVRGTDEVIVIRGYLLLNPSGTVRLTGKNTDGGKLPSIQEKSIDLIYKDGNIYIHGNQLLNYLKDLWAYSGSDDEPEVAKSETVKVTEESVTSAYGDLDRTSINEKRFSSPEEAAFAFAMVFASISQLERQEYGAVINKVGDSYMVRSIMNSAQTYSNAFTKYDYYGNDLPDNLRNNVDLYNNSSTVATIHTHWSDGTRGDGAGNLSFSKNDYNLTDEKGIPAYLVNRNGEIFVTKSNGSGGHTDPKDPLWHLK